MKKIQNYINHIAFVIDCSGSMSHLSKKVVEVFDKEISNLRQRSIDLNQETRISVYVFDDKVDCVVFDMDVMRMSSLKDYYSTGGSTALVDATLSAIFDMRVLPEFYGDHAFLVYVLTDGQENASHHSGNDLAITIRELKDNWTTVCLVPDATGVHEAKKFGFSANNIAIWNTTVQGIEKTGKEFRSAIDNYMTLRSQGLRSTKSFFSIDLSNVATKDVKKQVPQLKNYRILTVNKESVIKPFIENKVGMYNKGRVFYELVKTEILQPNKEIALQNRYDNRVYGGYEARQLLNLPGHEIKIRPADYGDWKIFVQSTSINRKLPANTEVLVLN